MREATKTRAAIDIDDFERRLRAPGNERKPAGDPLSELARLMHGDEAGGDSARRLDHLFAGESNDRALAGHAGSSAADEDFAAELRGAFDSAHDAPSAHEPAAYAGSFQAHYAEHEPGGADAGWEDDSAYFDYAEKPAPATAPKLKRKSLNPFKSRPRPWHAVAALTIAGAGIISYSIAHRSGVIGSREIVTIQAPEGPVKVAPPAAEAQSAPDQAESAVLDRQESAPVQRVVTRQEEPVEPAVEPQAQKPVLSQPKRVKTVSVRPDGTLVENPVVPPAVARATQPPPSEPAAKQTPATTPKATVKPVTPKLESLKPEKPEHAAKPETPKPEKPEHAAKPKPAPKVAATEPQQAEAAEAPEATETHGAGGFAVQFGAASSEAEARALMNKIAAKYGSKLGGRRPTFKIAKVGDKTVYRVRVHDLSKESATKVCGEVKAGGGNCFVAGAN